MHINAYKLKRTERELHASHFYKSSVQLVPYVKHLSMFLAQMCSEQLEYIMLFSC